MTKLACRVTILACRMKLILPVGASKEVFTSKIMLPKSMTKRPQSCKKRIIYIRRLLRSDTLIIKKSSKKEAAHVPVFKGYLVKKITKACLF